MSGWQPIETLPDNGAVIGRKVNQDGTDYGVIVGVKSPSVRKNGEWIVNEWTGRSSRCTHWMPLPPPPEA